LPEADTSLDHERVVVVTVLLDVGRVIKARLYNVGVVVVSYLRDGRLMACARLLCIAGIAFAILPYRSLHHSASLFHAGVVPISRSTVPAAISLLLNQGDEISAFLNDVGIVVITTILINCRGKIPAGE